MGYVRDINKALWDILGKHIKQGIVGYIRQKYKTGLYGGKLDKNIKDGIMGYMKQVCRERHYKLWYKEIGLCGLWYKKIKSLWDN